MISKELLSEILGEEVKEVYGEQSYMLCYLSSDIYAINIYELAHKCKMWAWDNGYELVIKRTEVEVYKNQKRVARFIGDYNGIYDTNLINESCEWIREQIGAS